MGRLQIDAAINICLKQNRSGEAIILAISSGRQDLFEKVQNIILKASAKMYPTANLISIAVKRNWHDLLSNCNLKVWRELLAWLLTYKRDLKKKSLTAEITRLLKF